MAPPMSMMRSRLGVAVLKSKLYAFGGYNGKDRLSSVEVYDAIRKEWSMVTPMLCKRRCEHDILKSEVLNVYCKFHHKSH